MPHRPLALVAVALLGCAVPTGERPTPPSPARTEVTDRLAPAALDGRETFALVGRPAARWVSVLETPLATMAVSDDGTLTDLSADRASAVDSDVLPELGASDDGRVVAYAVRTDDGIADVHVLVDGVTRPLTEGLGAVVLAVSPDGAEVAFLAASSGLPALWVVATDGGPPRQLTNVDLPRPQGRAPPGFVPPPRRAADVRWRDGVIVWEAAGGRWRIDAATGTVLERP